MKFLIYLILVTSFYSYSKDFQHLYLYLSAEVASREGNHDQSLHFLNQLWGLTKHPQVLLKKAQEFKNKGLTFQSQKICRSLIQRLKNDKSVQTACYLLLAEVNQSLRLFDKALLDYKKVLEMEPFHPQALLKVTLLQVQKGKKLSSYQKSLFKDDFSFHYSLGEIYLKKGLKNQALDSFKKSLSLNPSHRYSAWRIFQLEKPSLYISFVEKLNPLDSFVISLLARAHLKQNQRSKAQEYLEDLLWNDRSILDLKAEWIMGSL